MDTSEKYIKMCEKAGEIQKNWKLKELDQYAVISSSYRNGYILGEYIDGYYRQFRENAWLELIIKRHSIGVKDIKIVWLPRQDQLQEMIADIHCLPDRFMYFWDFVSENSYCPNHSGGCNGQFDSAEQLWLAFVMYGKHGKMWDDKKQEWIKEN